MYTSKRLAGLSLQPMICRERVYKHVQGCLHRHVYVRECVYVHAYVCVCVCVCVCVSVCVCVHTYVRLCECVSAAHIIAHHSLQHSIYSSFWRVQVARNYSIIHSFLIVEICTHM